MLNAIIININLLVANFVAFSLHVIETLSFEMLPMGRWIDLSLTLFAVGLCGIFFNNRNFLTVLLNIEVMLLGLGFLYIGFGTFLIEPKGHLYALVILVMAAMESCVGLAILTLLFRNQRSTSTVELSKLSL